MTGVIASLGPLGVFLLMIPESACIPIPSELTLMSAGFATTQHAMTFAIAVAAGTAGNLIGSLLAYAAGRAGLGRRTAVLMRCERLFARHGERAVLIARVLPLARTFVSLPAGRARVPLPRFVALTVLGCSAWCALFVEGGALAGAGWRAIGSTVGHVLLVAGVALTLLVLARAPGSSR
jgi:membrane protein DedA with SNARE-associated domain